MSALADELGAVLADRGPLPACDLAAAVRRRKASVLEALRSDPRFTRHGKRRSSRWELAPPGRSFDVAEAARRWGCNRETADELIFGPGGFLERGFVVSVNGAGGPVRVSEAGLAIAHAVRSLDPRVAA